MIAIVLILGLSVLVLVALFMLGVFAFSIAGDYQRGKDKQNKKISKTIKIKRIAYWLFFVVIYLPVCIPVVLYLFSLIFK